MATHKTKRTRAIFWSQRPAMTKTQPNCQGSRSPESHSSSSGRKYSSISIYQGKSWPENNDARHLNPLSPKERTTKNSEWAGRWRQRQLIRSTNLETAVGMLNATAAIPLISFVEYNNAIRRWRWWKTSLSSSRGEIFVFRGSRIYIIYILFCLFKLSELLNLLHRSFHGASAKNK